MNYRHYNLRYDLVLIIALFFTSVTNIRNDPLLDIVPDCESRGGLLAVIDSQQVQDFVVERRS